MFFLYQLLGLFELAWQANPQRAEQEIRQLALYAQEKGCVVAALLLQRCIQNLACGAPIGYFGDERQPAEFTPVQTVTDPAVPPGEVLVSTGAGPARKVKRRPK